MDVLIHYVTGWSLTLALIDCPNKAWFVLGLINHTYHEGDMCHLAVLNCQLFSMCSIRKICNEVGQFSLFQSLPFLIWLSNVHSFNTFASLLEYQIKISEHISFYPSLYNSPFSTSPLSSPLFSSSSTFVMVAPHSLFCLKSSMFSAAFFFFCS